MRTTTPQFPADCSAPFRLYLYLLAVIDYRRLTMTTSKETDWMNHPRLRKLVTAVNELTLAERLTLVKGLVPAIADELSDTEYEKFVASIRLKGERFQEAQAHPGEGRAERKIPGE